ncbi:MAG: Transcriptional regulator, AcrR family [uncultured Adhaeribacter sp.]|uniref:Transcriptional regulator, AcrR family n=1 Tax=uncultured Adhaeribacter sp. TaxID=448109 RepID=A0A6J4ILM8_9BACT|nr:MAG: Transcriptional regulator, AcrR family [uncultured Adhaeribacter sp.]
MEAITDKKKVIFKHTLELVRNHGFHGTTMSMLIKKSGVAAGTIYHYFDSKDTLIIELHGYIRSKMAAALLEGDDENKNYKDRFVAFWMRQWQFYTEYPDALYFIEQFVNSPYYQRCPEKENDRCQNIITHFVKTGVDTGILKPVNYKLMGIMVHSSVITAAKVKLNNRLETDEATLRQVVDMVWDGIENRKTVN